MQEFAERAAKSHAESVARGEHDDRCEYLAEPGFYLCNCSKRSREARGFTTPPELEHQYPICLGCEEEVDHDGDCFTCPRCAVNWPTSNGPGEFYDDYGDLAAELADLREKRARQDVRRAVTVEPTGGVL